jgi:hypothetical protein
MKFKLKQKKHPMPGVVHITANNLYTLAFAFMRLQEFYESPHKHILGKVASLEEFLDTYKKKSGAFTYMRDWIGFNVPGYIVKRFIKKYRNMGFLGKEKILLKLLKPALKSGKKFYVIGTLGNKRVQNHEFAHALWYLKLRYRKAMQKVIKGMAPSVRKRMNKGLKKLGYAKHVEPDEIQAYLSTSSMSEVHKQFGKRTKRKHTKKFRSVFSAWRS